MNDLTQVPRNKPEVWDRYELKAYLDLIREQEALGNKQLEHRLERYADQTRVELSGLRQAIEEGNKQIAHALNEQAGIKAQVRVGAAGVAVVVSGVVTGLIAFIHSFFFGN